jgi:flagellar basal-body rod protein FlgG
MIKGLYTGAAGMMTQLIRQDTIANNLANVMTTGYKKDIAVSASFPDILLSRLGESAVNQSNGRLRQLPPQLLGSLGTGAAVDAVYTDYTQGNLTKTDSPFDMAVTTDGFFTVAAPAGARYTRDGRFNVNAVGTLVNYQGHAVLDIQGQPIQIEQTARFDVNERGDVFVDDAYVASIQVVRFDDVNALVKEGNTYFQTDQAAEPIAYPGIRQGWQETSNVNAVQEMVALISVMRAYEFNQKVIQAEDDMSQTAMSNASTV